MIVAVHCAPEEPKAMLQDARNFKQFHVTVTGDRAALAEAVTAASVGRVDGDHVWVDRSWLEGQGPADEEWRQGLDSMLAFAASKGWMSEDGRAVRAHVSA
jgi:hypothetical protein